MDAFRSQIPALSERVAGRPAVYLDGPGGTQVSRPVVDAVSTGLVEAASNVGGSFAASRNSSATVDRARAAAADLLGGAPGEIVFGPNMTSLTFSFSRALAARWAPGDQVVVTRLDHDANVAPWLRAAADRGAEVVFADIDPDTVTLDLDHLESLLGDRTRLVAVTGCSNAFGSLVDVRRVADAARAVGAVSYVDAVHLVPHRRVDVATLGVDVLVCSAYKFYGPHVGVLWARREVIDRTEAYKVRPAPGEGPAKFETGTPSFALLAGVEAAVDVLASLGEGPSRRARLDDAFERIERHAATLGERLLRGLPDRVRVWGLPTMAGRVPTFAFSVEGMHPWRVAEILGEQGIFTWAGHYYAVEPMARLGLLDGGGLVRVGLMASTNTADVDRLLEALETL